MNLAGANLDGRRDDDPRSSQEKKVEVFLARDPV
jgi:hypothetical protein